MTKRPQASLGSEKNIILFAGKVFPQMIEDIRRWSKTNHRSFRVAIFRDKNHILKPKEVAAEALADIIIICDTFSPTAIQKALLPYEKHFFAITCRGEDSIPLLARTIPHVPYLRTPTSESLIWSSDKLLMRRRMRIYSSKIAPKYTTVKNTSVASLKKIEEKVGFPLMVKPTGLAESRLVTLCFHKEELEKTLKHTFRHINSVYKEAAGNWEPRILVEEYMEGDMYSVDAYVSPRGRVYFCPMVHVTTGRSVGFEDFFGYKQMTPTKLSKKSTGEGELIAKQAIYALGLRSTVAHVELLKTETGWKVIELGARIGGFRPMLYEKCFGINHTMNDILVRAGEKPMIPRKVKGYGTAMKFFAKKEGRLQSIHGLKKVQLLSSFQEIFPHKKTGDFCRFAQHGGGSVFDIILFNKSRTKLLADIRRVEQSVDIVTNKTV
jgi:biotin carboxylase